MGVQVFYDDALLRLAMPEPERAELARAMMYSTGFERPSGDAAMWTDPFSLFTSLFPVLGYAPSHRCIEPAHPSSVDGIINEIRTRARGRRCVGLFWSSCESANNFANRNLCLPDLELLFEDSRDVYWGIMQRGFERRRWLNDPRSADLDRFTTLSLI